MKLHIKVRPTGSKMRYYFRRKYIGYSYVSNGVFYKSRMLTMFVKSYNL